MFNSTIALLVYAVLGFSALISPISAQTITVTTVHAFQGGTDGGSPAGNIVIGPDGSIYGKTIENPSNITVFRLSPQTGLNTSVFAGNAAATDDANSGIVFGTNGALYSASYFNAGSGQCYAGCGLIFQINGGTGAMSSVYQFTNTGDGRGAWGVVMGPGGVLYGAADEGGTDHQGSIFELDPTIGKLSTLYSFTGGSDGGNPDGVGLLFGPDAAIYGETVGGGEYGNGTLFRIFPFSHAFQVLHQFSVADGNTHVFNEPPNIAFAKGVLYGTTVSGGAYGKGMLYRLASLTGPLVVLHSFSGADGSTPTRLVQGLDGNLYGLTYYGGAGNFGTIFKYDVVARVFTSIYSFSNGSDGAYPGQGGLVVSMDGTIYGTAQSGGGPNGSGSGTVFKFKP